ncbi:MAG: class II fructose-bisphosphate aldolase [Firmicutes bacterium]|nr:class II fructose-bisphosphate aldolase [Bacillota bacterium]
MPLVTAACLLEHAQANTYAIPSFNFHDLVDLQAIVTAAEAEAAPVILMASEGTIRFAGFPYIEALARVAASQAKVPLALHLDHGRELDNIMKGIRHGFTSVMFDGSHLAYAENVRLTNWVVDVAHRAGISVEGELGQIPGTEDDISVAEQAAGMTDPGLVAEYVERTGVDALAVAIGTAHGLYKGEPQLDFDRLAAIRQAAVIPLVLHGGTGVPDATVRQAINLGICKLNVGTDLRLAYTGSIDQALKEHEINDPRPLLDIAREAVIEVVRDKIRLCGASGQAKAIKAQL